eukprot:CAMPEP_0173422102 /NCGR_PEP_ID=MMETSP1357-20121228/2936_1 /TAXON_ID=77926 /ORGANISM="Hemiselmis rufescens, Strain PCC563" /LENGTH=124 /DNA_ID=CAMNT_0014385079 /DNA_START=63 /DNA_END=437 /DNA_ORIENTATION=-
MTARSNFTLPSPHPHQNPEDKDKGAVFSPRTPAQAMRQQKFTSVDLSHNFSAWIHPNLHHSSGHLSPERVSPVAPERTHNLVAPPADEWAQALAPARSASPRDAAVGQVWRSPRGEKDPAAGTM